MYMFASTATRHEKGKTCLDGMRLLADTLHPLGVPITWIMSAGSARIAKDTLCKWHEEHGDAVAVQVPTLSGDFEEKKAAIAGERDAIAEALPWAELTVAAGHQDFEIPALLEDLGFDGLWGFCWEQIEVDQITDRGSPWGCYFMRRDQRLAPAGQRGVVAMEWTARDLLKSYHSGNPCLYSTDPNDVARGGLCSWEEIGYWKDMADNYLRNTRYNEHVFLLQHQEAHEMERSDLCKCYTPEDIREAAVMLDGFVRHIKDRAVFLTLPQAARLYRDTYAHAASSYMLWEDSPTPPYNPDYSWSTPTGPWPRTFLFHDCRAQLIFIEGKVEPVCIRNYGREWRSGEYFAEPMIPRARLVHNTRFGWRREIVIDVESPSAMPYGMALWGDYSLYQLDDCPGLLEGKMMSRELLFLRYDVVEGTNRFTIHLQGK